MPYPKDHKAKTRERILEAARVLFNRRGYDRVTIDQVMAEANLTRGGFYAHFSSKEELFADAMIGFLEGRGARWRAEEKVDPTACQLVMAQRMVDAYLSRRHLADRDGQCPLIAYATDVANAGPRVRDSYRHLVEAMVWLFEMNLEGDPAARRSQALSLTALCVGGMILARAIPETRIAQEVLDAAHAAATGIWNRPAAVAQAGPSTGQWPREEA
ncbi:TetR/AcrR family transcriptional regulator [Nitratireductor pacificus]|uniref:TetR family transcriptional regulator n=1 Tax=Nitratireductor pacificus pht-3B TaxID=391937 RepID=K2MPY0_9HYPH|nr:TetR/AcrR family transcriptional regulator [Nitratireductor pacificus]EKF19387.1 TetR family transcriptional regulator [Nitratireductor pacificus pht-3B]